jgi:hypothetical protein
MLRLTLMLALILLLIPVAYAVPNRIPVVSNDIQASANVLTSSPAVTFSLDNISGSQFLNDSYSISPADLGDAWPGGIPGKESIQMSAGFHPGHGSGPGGGGWPGHGRGGGWPDLGKGGGGGGYPAAVPEPTTFLLFGAGLAGAGVVRKIRQA